MDKRIRYGSVLSKRLCALVGCGLFLAAGLPAASQEPPERSPAAESQVDAPKPRRGPGGAAAPRNRGVLDERLRERMRNLPPEAQERFKRNMRQWQEMPPDMQERIKRRHARMLEKGRKEVSRILEESGVEMTEERRRQFLLRYIRERQDLERELREELMKSRNERLPRMIEEIKADYPEFQEGAAQSEPEDPATPPEEADEG